MTVTSIESGEVRVTGRAISRRGPDAADRAITGLGVSLAALVYVTGLPGLYLDGALGQLRYLVYAAPLLFFSPFLLTEERTVHQPALVLFCTYGLWSAAFYASGVEDREAFLINAGIISLVILAFVPKLEVTRRQIELMFYATFVYSLLAFVLTDHGGARIFLILESGTGTGLVDAYGNHEGLLGPLYALFFHATGAKLPFWLAMVMCVLGGKRIGLLALAAGFVLFWGFRFLDRRFGSKGRVPLLIAMLTVINAVSVNLISIADTLHRNLEIRVNIEEVMLGRHEIGRELTRSIEAKPMSSWLLGSGAGAADAISGKKLRHATGDLPHNDWLKVFYDYGLVGSVILTLALAFLFSGSAAAAAIGVVSAIIMMTDNVLIYVFYQVPLALMMAHCSPVGWGRADARRPERRLSQR